MTQVAPILDRLVAGATCTDTLRLIGRTVSLHASTPELLATFELPQFVWERVTPDLDNADLCVVTTMADLDLNETLSAGPPTRMLQHPTVGTLRVYDLEDAVVAIHEGRGAFVLADDGRAILATDHVVDDTATFQKPNLTDLGNLLTGTMLSRQGFLLVHAGAVGTGGVCRVFTGESGSGKTTLTLRLVSSGLDFYGDDMIIVGRQDDAWIVRPFWRALNISANTCRMIPSLQHLAESFTGPGKQSFEIADLFECSTPPPARIEAVYAVGPSGPEPPELMSFPDAVALLGQTFLTALTRKQTVTHLDLLMDFIDDVPVYRTSWDFSP